jgi:hypothetical protein
MRGSTIDNEKDRSLGARNQAFQELGKNIGVDPTFFLYHEPLVAARSDR